MKLEYEAKGELEKVALEILEFLKPRDLPIWQVKETLDIAKRFSEYQKLN